MCRIRCGGLHDLVDGPDGFVDFGWFQRWVDHEHDARFPQLLSDREPVDWSEARQIEGIFQVDLAAGSRSAGNPFGLQILNNAVSAPAGIQIVRPDEGIVFVVAVSRIRGRQGNPQGGDF